jgi:predicted phosphoadenosine phosphosulfate sulfurtransferase
MAKMLRKQVVDRTVLELAYERIHRAYDLFDTVDVSFSGGKDSTACLNLTLQVARERGRLPLRVFFHDEECIPLQTEQYVRRVAQNPDIALEWYCLPVQHRNACSRKFPFWSPWDPSCPELWVRDLPSEAITQLEGFRTDGSPGDRLTIPEANGLLHDPAKYGTCGMIMGIRAQESIIRQRALSTRKEENYLVHWTDGTSKGNIWKVYPCYDWRTEDVWTAPTQFGWDYNEAYDIMTQCGITPHAQRCSPAFGEEPLLKFHTYKTCFPEIWDKMSARVPGANTAMLYARSELYGINDWMEKPEHLTWEDFVLNYVTKFSAETAPLVANNVRKMISEHYGKTSDPILSATDHPVTGISWKRIVNVAMRGDFKGRRIKSIITSNAHNRAVSRSRGKFGRDDQEFIAEYVQKEWSKYNEARRAEGL